MINQNIHTNTNIDNIKDQIHAWEQSTFFIALNKYNNRSHYFYFYKLKFTIDIALYINSQKLKVFNIEDENNNIKTYGRIESIRIHSSITFIMLQYNIQVSLTNDIKTKYDDILQVGDIVYIDGIITKTSKSFSLNVHNIYPAFPMIYSMDNTRTYYLSKSNNINNIKKVLYNSQYYKEIRFLYQELIQTIRMVLLSASLREVFVPILTNFIYGGNELNPFKTFCSHENKNLYLSSAPESYLKQLIALGEFDGVFTFARNFRNEESDSTHHYEFLAMEAYFNNSTNDIIIQFLINNLFSTIKNKFNLNFNIYSYTLFDLVNKYSQILIQKEYFNLSNTNDIINISHDDICNIYHILIDNNIEMKQENIVHPEVFAYEFFDKYIINQEFNTDDIFIIKYMPSSLTPFAEQSIYKNFSDSTEIYFGQIEGINMYSECSDGITQYNQVMNNCRTDYSNVDIELIDTLCIGMGITCGIGIGIERFASFLFKKPFADWINFKI